MNRRPWFLPAAVAMAALATPVSAEVFQFTGAAESGDGKALYEERHRIEGSCDNGVFQPLEHRVRYIRQAEGDAEAFAEKNLDYRSSSIRPRVNYQQPDFDESLEITYPECELTP